MCVIMYLWASTYALPDGYVFGHGLKRPVEQIDLSDETIPIGMASEQSRQKPDFCHTKTIAFSRLLAVGKGNMAESFWKWFFSGSKSTIPR